MNLELFLNHSRYSSEFKGYTAENLDSLFRKCEKAVLVEDSIFLTATQVTYALFIHKIQSYLLIFK